MGTRSAPARGRAHALGSWPCRRSMFWPPHNLDRRLSTGPWPGVRPAPYVATGPAGLGLLGHMAATCAGCCAAGCAGSRPPRGRILHQLVGQVRTPRTGPVTARLSHARRSGPDTGWSRPAVFGQPCQVEVDLTPVGRAPRQVGVVNRHNVGDSQVGPGKGSRAYSHGLSIVVLGVRANLGN